MRSGALQLRGVLSREETRISVPKRTLYARCMSISPAMCSSRDTPSTITLVIIGSRYYFSQFRPAFVVSRFVDLPRIVHRLSFVFEVLQGAIWAIQGLLFLC
ncbi:hypothetical protein BC936DRAFT_144930 [Jimgerdemannia flammicorona]|uniref:Uncharacterized protein n=1 Tax=Jimgerdemannia flammicorona TaxID=994334 RepID=A0A433DBC3_9FUNG|nr:hypothetical protein BC936DRAFT_144930 [Jimgerdemannia flammicorona]